ncbi:molybdate transporter family protein [Propylenella binzhouense]|uniref:molybdate transporter family protein n=1 Tax=Propylenella binzhouense TaxID=2555902 RepID=UPI001966FB6A
MNLEESSGGSGAAGAERAPPRPRARVLSDLGGAFGDLGTFVPHVVGAIAVAGLAPAGVFLGFGLFLVASGLFYGIPMAVQPMKAVSALLLTGELDAGEMAATGLALGIVLLLLGATGTIGRIARLIPQSVTTGLQLGLGLSMVLLGAGFMADEPWIGAAALALLLGLPRLGLPAAPITVAAALALAALGGGTALPSLSAEPTLPRLLLPDWSDLAVAVERGLVSQLPLTLTNAIIVTAALARDLFPEARSASVRNLALSTGIANLVLAPFGAMPMCHGAGGLQAQYRFGARTGLAPILFGALLILVGCLFAESAVALFRAIPLAAVGALLAIAGADLALSRRLLDARPACRPSIALAAAGLLVFNPAVGLAAGWGAEIVRVLLRPALPPSTPRPAHRAHARRGDPAGPAERN